MKISARKIAVAALVCGTALFIGLTDRSGISLRLDNAQAAAR
jgi:hypothetical protein